MSLAKTQRNRQQRFVGRLSLSLTLWNFWKARVSIRRRVFGSCTGSLVGQSFSGSCSSTLIYFKPSVKLARSQVLHLHGLKQCTGSRPSLHTAAIILKMSAKKNTYFVLICQDGTFSLIFFSWLWWLETVALSRRGERTDCSSFQGQDQEESGGGGGSANGGTMKS